MEPLDRVTFMQRDLTECTDEVRALLTVNEHVFFSPRRLCRMRAGVSEVLSVGRRDVVRTIRLSVY